MHLKIEGYIISEKNIKKGRSLRLRNRIKAYKLSEVKKKRILSSAASFKPAFRSVKFNPAITVNDDKKVIVPPAEKKIYCLKRHSDE